VNDSYDILKVIKQAALEAVRESDPADVHYGTVESADGNGRIGKIKIDQQWEIDGDQAIVPQHYQKHTIKKVKIKGNIIAQIHALLDNAKISYDLDDGCAKDEALVDVTIADLLQAGDKVIITRQQGGQQFLVTGRMGDE